MHRDHKLALALALLLIGVAAALCFPRQPQETLADLELEDADQLDARIDLLPVRVYTEPHDPRAEREEAAADREPPEFQPELRDPFAEFALLPGAPDPIPLADVTPPANDRPSDRDTPVSPPIRVGAWPESAGDGMESTATGRQAVEPDEAEQPLVHEVQPGDTLSGLAGRFLGSTARYVELYEANRHILASPDDLRIGMRLVIPRQPTAARPTDAADASPNAMEPGRQPRFRPVFGH